jgi:hypothetical protein
MISGRSDAVMIILIMTIELIMMTIYDCYNA